MRVSTLSTILAIPLVAAIAVDHRPHAAVPHAAVLRRRQAAERDIMDIIDPLGLIHGSSSSPESTPVISTPVVVSPVSPTDKTVDPKTTSHVTPPTTSESVSSTPDKPESTSSSVSDSSVSPSSTGLVTPSVSASSSSLSSSESSSVVPQSTSAQPVPTTSHEATSEAPVASVDPTPTESSTEPSSTSDVLNIVYKTVGNVVETIYESATSTATAGSAKSEGLSKGAIIGIAVGASVGGLALIAVLILFLVRRRQSDDEPMRWPELNHHGDTQTGCAVPVSRSSGHDGSRRMSLGDDLDDGPAYLGDVDPSSVAGLNPAFGSNGLLDYDEKAAAYPQTSPGTYGFDDHASDYASYPPAVQPQPSPVHGAPYDWESSDGAYSGESGYAGMTRQTSPTMAGVGSGGMTFPQPNVQHGGSQY